MSLKNGRVTAIRGSTVTISFGSAFHRDRVKQTDAARQVEEAMSDKLKQSVRIDCLLEADTGAKALPAEELVNLAEAASEVF